MTNNKITSLAELEQFLVRAKGQINRLTKRQVYLRKQQINLETQQAKLVDSIAIAREALDFLRGQK